MNEAFLEPLFYSIYFIILPHKINYKYSRINNRLFDIKFKISIQLGRSNCGGEISEKPTGI